MHTHAIVLSGSTARIQLSVEQHFLRWSPKSPPVSAPDIGWNFENDNTYLYYSIIKEGSDCGDVSVIYLLLSWQNFL